MEKVVIEKLLDEPYWNELESYFNTRGAALSVIFTPIILKLSTKEQILSQFVLVYLDFLSGDIPPRTDTFNNQQEAMDLIKSNLPALKEAIIRNVSIRIVNEDGFTIRNYGSVLSVSPSEEEVKNYLEPINDVQDLFDILVDQIIINTEEFKNDRKTT